MLILYESWTNIKNIVNTNNLQLQFIESNDLYKIFVTHNQNIHIVELWKNTDIIKGIDITQNNLDITDFETNFKNISDGVFNDAGVTDIGDQNIATIEVPKKNYISKIITVDISETEFDLGSVYTEFTIIVIGDKNIIIKLNDVNNDEIPLSGGQNIRDIIGADAFEINKIYHRTTGSGDISQILLWAIK